MDKKKNRLMDFCVMLSVSALAAYLMANYMGNDAAALEPLSVKRPLVVELFTSQGCPACPPAERFMQEFMAREDVIALSYHVDYWNDRGWEDPYSLKDATEKQKYYAGRFRLRGLFTPQMVIDGADQASGNDRGSVFDAIREQAGQMPAVPVKVEKTDTLITIEAGAKEFVVEEGSAEVWLVAYRHYAMTDVTRGPNRGQKIAGYHIVNAMYLLGSWQGGVQHYDAPLEKLAGAEGLAVLLQGQNGGRILGAAKLDIVPSPAAP